ncbi:APC family permease [Paenarthrobacter sp. DKR-5]|uniref:APC family permease n=1 Tax=Paenarthrobacter sp. DKR-5 TaxID=2835535 RepID=UPI001BDCA51C|nr:APC family permease [Paenarthrobacter sp. DKR-5]MBT1004178.1 APC family permease [Paenarthrobacter sp. DKR-5]
MASIPTNSPQLRRRIGSFQATALNMSQMVGIGPFITIPAMIVAFGGPQAVVGWIAGAVLALADGLIWAELGAAMPGSGGTYVYLREAFKYRTGRLMPFLFVWSAVLFIPLVMSTGVIGFVQYLGFLAPDLDGTAGTFIGLGLIALIVAVLWRRIESLGKLTVVLWAVMILTVLTVIIACFTHFNGGQVVDFPAGAFDITSGGFWVAFVAGLTIGIYDYLGYNTSAYMGAEMKNAGRTIPRSVVFSVLGIMVIYLLTQIGVLGVVKWQEMLSTDSLAYTSVVSLVLQRTWGAAAANVVTVFILVTAFASLMVGLLAGSRVPYDAARDGVFFRVFAKLHPRKEFPVAGLVTMGLMTAAGFLIGRATNIGALIQLLTAVMVLVQAIGQVVAVVALRRRRPDMKRPYKMWLYPAPLAVAGIGWLVIYLYSDINAPGLHPMELSLAWVAAGVACFLVWAKREKTWPFGPLPVERNEVDEEIAVEAAEEVHV